MQSITSRENSYYKLAKSLQSPKGRKENGLYAIEGAKLIEEALEMRQRFHSAAFAFDKTEKHQGVIRLLEESSIPVYAMPGAMMESVCGTETPQGAFALLHAPSFDLPDDLLQLGTKTVTLDGVQDPGNVGTIMRTAQAFGAGSVVLGKGCASPLNPKVVRSCMGAIFRIPVYETDDIADLLAAL
ncbi:MAG: RNA methyltransferase, partial [Bacillota bacterium]|nr:RNA methyltransferase [Bacillota bacterium]